MTKEPYGEALSIKVSYLGQWHAGLEPFLVDPKAPVRHMEVIDDLVVCTHVDARLDDSIAKSAHTRQQPYRVVAVLPVISFTCVRRWRVPNLAAQVGIRNQCPAPNDGFHVNVFTSQVPIVSG